MGPPRVNSDKHKELNSEGANSIDKAQMFMENFAHLSDLKSLTCGICSRILRSPMQLISCGCRFCSDCIESFVKKTGISKLLCPTDEEEFNMSQIKKDKGCMKEIEQLYIECQAKTSCGWKGSLSRLEFSKHLDVCTECELDCPMNKVTQCKFVGKRAQMNDHVMANHMLSMVEKVMQQDSTLCSRLESLEAVNKQLCDRVDRLEVVNSLLQKELRDNESKLNVVKKKLETLEQDCRTTVSHGSLDCSSLTNEYGSNYESNPQGTGRSVSTHRFSRQLRYSQFSSSSDGHENKSLTAISKPVPTMTHMIKEMVDKHDNQIFHLQSEMQTIHQNFNKCSLTLDEMKLRQDIQDVQTTNGVFIWKIPDIRRRYRDALEEKTVSLYSPPFRTSSHGYRMCMRIYLSGDGTGKGTYVSLFFVLMRSEHDGLLPFPFRQSVRFTLLNQVTRADSISEAFAPDLNSQSFQRPKSDMNVASGFPRFAKQTILQDENFTKGNSIYIKAQVDLAGLTLE